MGIEKPVGLPLQVGLLIDGPLVSKYVYDLAVWALDNEDGVSVTHLVVHAPLPVAADKSAIRRFLTRMKRRGFVTALSQSLASLSYRAVVRFEQLLLKKNKRHSDHLQMFDVSKLVPASIRIVPQVSKSGLVYRFSPAEVDQVRSLELDLLLRCGSGILHGDILRAARLGIVSFHHADNRVNRGGPPGFWEVYFRHEATGFTIQQLTEELDGGNVLMRGHFATQSYYLLNQAALFEKSNHYLKFFLKKIARNGALPEPLEKLPYSNVLFRLPRVRQAILYCFKSCYHLGSKVLRKALHIEYRWNVAYTRSDWRDAVLSRGKRLKALPYHFLADPFVITKDGKDFCFVEDYDYFKERGTISVYELGRDGEVRLGTALEEDFHLSFPFLFEYAGNTYMCPETAEKKEIRIYRSTEFPREWILEKVIMRDISAADTMLFEKDGKWWMFTNIDATETGDHCCELSIFFSDSPFGAWTPHPLNPIMVDSRRARNAGLLGEAGNYFRVSQKQGFARYGMGFSVNKIDLLTELAYSESCHAEITPTFNAEAVGTHHLHSNGQITVFDFASFSRISRNNVG
jgi:hypothetical protein